MESFRRKVRTPMNGIISSFPSQLGKSNLVWTQDEKMYFFIRRSTGRGGSCGNIHPSSTSAGKMKIEEKWGGGVVAYKRWSLWRLHCNNNRFFCSKWRRDNERERCQSLSWKPEVLEEWYWSWMLRRRMRIWRGGGSIWTHWTISKSHL